MVSGRIYTICLVTYHQTLGITKIFNMNRGFGKYRPRIRSSAFIIIIVRKICVSNVQRYLPNKILSERWVSIQCNNEIKKVIKQSLDIDQRFPTFFCLRIPYQTQENSRTLKWVVKGFLWHFHNANLKLLKIWRTPTDFSRTPSW